MNQPFAKAVAILIGLASLGIGCATPRSSALIPIRFSEQSPRLLMRTECNGQRFTTQGMVVCEQKSPSAAVVSVKVPPIEGRVVYSNGELKKTEDFNWYPKEGFWLWKKKPIKDTWADLDLGEINADFGDWPVAMDVMGVSSVGVINTRGILYYRICDDQDVPCSRLVVEFQCGGHSKATGEGKLGKCDRIAGSAQTFTIKLKTASYAAKGAKLYVSVPRNGIEKSITMTESDESKGEFKFELPGILSGPTLVGFRLSWYEGQELKRYDTRILLHGSPPEWIPLDTPHALIKGNGTADLVRPVLSDLLEANRYDANGVLTRKGYSSGKMIEGFPLPSTNGKTCVYAWSRDSSDCAVSCLNFQGDSVDAEWK